MGRKHNSIVASVVSVSMAVVGRRAHAQTVATRAPTATSYAATTLPSGRTGNTWAVDETFRSLFRASQQSTRLEADAASTALLATMVAAPFAFSVANTVALHGSWRDAAMLSLVDTEVLMTTYGAVFLAKLLVDRERPYGTTDGLLGVCTANPHDPRCAADRSASFFSGHSAMAFASAGLICSEEMYLDGARGFSALDCGGAMAVATATAMLRMVADMHYASDTLVGAAVGLSAGLLLPMALHFSPWSPFPVARSLRAASIAARDARRAPLALASGTPHPGATSGEDPPASRVQHGFISGFRLSPWTTAGGGGVSIGVATF